MKTNLFFAILFCISFTFLNAQSTWIGAGANTNWNTQANWDNNAVPTATDDVIIPTGFTVTLNIPSSVKSINLQGNSVFEMNTNLTFTEPSTFGINTTVNWAAGALNGTTSTLTNLGTINMTTASINRISGSTTLDNQGVLNFTSGGDLWIDENCILNNPIGGIIDIQADSANIHFNSVPGVLNNAGLIKKTTSTGESFISIPINNNDGTIQVEVGTLSFQNQTTDKNFNDGTYNVFAGATMDWDTTINPSGTLEGTIVGDLNWNSFINIPTGETATINFSETDNFNWKSGNLNGGGTLINANVLKLKATSVPYRISEATTLDNQGILIFTAGGNLWIDENCILNNPIGGIIDMQADGGNIAWNGTAGVLNNAGLIKRTTTFGQAFISVVLNNSGTIQIETGELEIANSQPFTNEVTGIVKGIGIFDLPLVANYTNNGTFAPGLSPGTLNVQGDYTSTESSVLDIELDGLTQGTGYDLLAIQGNADFDGDINITLGFLPSINDEFIIATTTGTINSFNFPSTGSAMFNNSLYEYDIMERNTNEIVITITSVTLGINENEFIESQVKLFPNPSNSFVTIEMNSEINGNWQLINQLGQIIKESSFEASELKISVQEISSGMYFLKITDSDLTIAITKRIIVSN